MGPIHFGPYYVIYTNNKKGLVWNRTPWFLEALYTGKLLTNNIVFKKKFWYICVKYYPVVIQTEMEISNSACISQRGFGYDTMQLAKKG